MMRPGFAPIPPIIDSDGIHKTFDIKFINLAPLGAPWRGPRLMIMPSGNHHHLGLDLRRRHQPHDLARESRRRTIALQNKTLWSALSKTDLLVAPPGFTVAQPDASFAPPSRE